MRTGLVGLQGTTQHVPFSQALLLNQGQCLPPTPRGYLIKSGNILNYINWCGGRGAVISSGWRPEIQLTIQQCTGQTPTAIIRSKTSVVSRLKNPDLKQAMNSLAS